MTYAIPIKPINKPRNLKNVKNGELPSEMLKQFQSGTGGFLHRRARRQATRMCAAARKAGIELTFTYGGCYRSLAAQEALFFQRFEPGYRVGYINKSYKGNWYHLADGMANAATPGTSNHGWGLAIDFALGTHPSNVKPLDFTAIMWLIGNADSYGFCGELVSEPWHWVNYKLVLF